MYYLNPVSWTLYGLVASNVGDLDNASINLNGGVGPDDIVTVPQFLRQQFDYRHVSKSLTPVCGKLPVLSVKHHDPVSNCCQGFLQMHHALVSFATNTAPSTGHHQQDQYTVHLSLVTAFVSMTIAVSAQLTTPRASGDIHVDQTPLLRYIMMLQDWLGYVVLILLGWIILFWGLGAYAFKRFNFQKR